MICVFLETAMALEKATQPSKELEGAKQNSTRKDYICVHNNVRITFIVWH